MAYGTPNLILRAVRNGLRKRLQLSESSCYISMEPMFDPDYDWRGGTDLYQVSPGPVQNYGGGSGAQDGGGNMRRFYFKITLWFRMQLDPGSSSEELLTRQAEGLLDRVEKVIDLFKNTNLGQLVFERVNYEGDSTPVWVDQASSVARKDISFSAPFGVDLPFEQTLSAADIS